MAGLNQTRDSPLRDRLFSSSAIDPVKTSILRESGMGWSSPQTKSAGGDTNSITSPLRIAKRESPRLKKPLPQGADVARRTSSSYRHVRNNNLVTKSPFKSQIPTATPGTPSRPTNVAFPAASPRRVSGEKRPRPPSMHEEAENENERPFALKRERKQSKTFQNLIQKEPVTKSPFKRIPSSEEDPFPPPPPPPRVLSDTIPTANSTSRLPIPSFTPTTPTRPILARSNAGNGSSTTASPTRSSLVSRRMHGPRLSNAGKRERRKTVTFDERCDVVEFDRESGESDVFDSDGDRYRKDEDEDELDPFFLGQQGGVVDMQHRESSHDGPGDANEHATEPAGHVEDSYESIALSDIDTNAHGGMMLDPDSSITGLVDEMFGTVQPSSQPSPSALRTPSPTIPPDLDAEDGVPYGRTHHADRQMQYRNEYRVLSPVHELEQPINNIIEAAKGDVYPFKHPAQTLAETPSTPPRRAVSPKDLPEGPLGRSTHMERIRAARTEDKRVEEDVKMLPASPSPMKHTPRRLEQGLGSLDTLVPKFELPGGTPSKSLEAHTDGPDPFALPNLKDESLPELANTEDDSVSPSNLSIGNSEVSLSGPQTDLGLAYDDDSKVMDHEDIKSESSFEHRDSQVHETNLPKHEVLFSASSPDVSPPPQSATFRQRTGSPTPSSLPRHLASPLFRAVSPPLAHHSSSSSLTLSSRGSSESLVGTSLRPRISREDIRKRMGTTGTASPKPPSRKPVSPQEDSVATSNSRVSDHNIQTSSGTGHMLEPDREKDGISVMTEVTDHSAEVAVIKTVEKTSVQPVSAVSVDLKDVHIDIVEPPAPTVNEGKEFGLRVPSAGSSFGLKFDFGSKFGLGGLGINGLIGDSTSSRGSVDEGKPVEHSIVMPPPSSCVAGLSTNIRMSDVDVEMRSALDRLMEDMGGSSHLDDVEMDDSGTTNTEDGDSSRDISPPRNTLNQTQHPKPVERAATDSVLLPGPGGGFVPSSRSTSVSSIPPPVPPKDNIRSREEMILEKRREARRREEGLTYSPPLRSGMHLSVGGGRPSRRRSMSTGDAEQMSEGSRIRSAMMRGEGSDSSLLDVGRIEDPLADSIEKELRKLDGAKKNKYHVREREGIVYATSGDKVSHLAGPGDVNAGKAWRAVRRPSDMNEYSKQIKEYRAQEKPGKAYGKVFVKVLGIKGVHLPLPQQPTAVSCTLNNGIHFVTTPECQLGKDCRIDQEFELIEHSKLEFTLTLKVRRDPHIIAQYKAVVSVPPRPAPPPVIVQTSSKGGVLSFFHSSPKKSKEKKQSPPPIQPTPRLTENLARYLKPDGTLARAFVSFRDIAARCDTRLFETSYPLIGQRLELGNKLSTLQVGEIILQIFRLPPLPGIPPEQLPQSLEECLRSLRHINWHKVTYFEGTLTQNGGDCSSWRRRQFRVIGGNLVAFNDVTKKATATIDLKRAIAVEDDQEARNDAMSPASGMTSRSTRYADDYDILGGVERSFRLIFPEDEDIIFFADTDEEKSRWLEVLRALVGHIPPHPFWAELLWQRQEEQSRRSTAAASQPALHLSNPSGQET